MSDNNLDQIVFKIKTENPNDREVMLRRRLCSKNIVVQRQHVRESLWRVFYLQKNCNSEFAVAIVCFFSPPTIIELKPFTAILGRFGRPLHIRTDHRGGNPQIWKNV